MLWLVFHFLCDSVEDVGDGFLSVVAGDFDDLVDQSTVRSFHFLKVARLGADANNQLEGLKTMLNFTLLLLFKIDAIFEVGQ